MALNGGIIGQASNAADKYNQAAEDEKWLMAELEGYMDVRAVSKAGYDETAGVNKPALKQGMIPIYYDGTNWKKADENNAGEQWYKYTEVDRQYANICTVADENKTYRTAAVDTVIPIEDMTTMFVWIPRYAYSINAGGYRTQNLDTVPATNANPIKKIDVTFLVGNTDKDAAANTYQRDYNIGSVAQGAVTPKIVHPGFKFGNKELTGIWAGKFEVSGKNSSGQYVGNSNGVTDAEAYAPDSSTHVQVLPNAISWRYITIGEMQYQAMKMSSDTSHYGWSGANTHLIKNSEWGVAAYLSYSQYGRVPEINGAGKSIPGGGYYDYMTGAGPQAAGDESVYGTYAEETHGYDTTLGQLASTTGNVYGVYDMSGGAWDAVAAYLDNKSSTLTTYGKSSSTSVTYFEDGELKSVYKAYWDNYEVNPEERNDEIVTTAGNKTKEELWEANATTQLWNDTRLNLTTYIFDHMASKKGIGVNETAENFSFYGINGSTYEYGWYITVGQSNSGTKTYGRSWNSDYTLIGHASAVLVTRGRSMR